MKKKLDLNLEVKDLKKEAGKSVKAAYQGSECITRGTGCVCASFIFGSGGREEN